MLSSSTPWFCVVTLWILLVRLALAKKRKKRKSLLGDVADALEREHFVEELQARRWHFLAFFCLLYVMDIASQTAFSTSFTTLERNLNFSPGQQGFILMLQSMSMALSSIMWALAADGAAGRNVTLAFGCSIWAVATLLTAFVGKDEFHLLAAIRCAFGFGSGSIRPIVQSMIADIFRESEHGTAFASTMASSSLGILLTTPVVAVVKDQVLDVFGIGSIEGWRLCFICLGFLSVAFCLIVSASSRTVVYPASNHAKVPWSEILALGRVPSCWLVILIGCCTCSMLETHSLLVAWCEYLGHPDSVVGVLVAGGLFACTVGSMVGGYLADKAACTYPIHGRIFVGEAGVVFTLLAWIHLVVQPMGNGQVVVGASLAALGVAKPWIYVGTCRPILMAFVKSRARPTLIALVEVIEGVFPALTGPVIVGILAERQFGYTNTELRISDLTEDKRATNLHALTCGLTIVNLTCLAVSLLCALLLQINLQLDVDRTLT